MRVSLARALVTDPDILLMDEPFAALDEITRFRLNNDLLALWRDLRKTVIFVTHSVFESVYLSQRVIVMTPRPGRIAAEFRIETPEPRGEDFRTSAEYAGYCRTVSARAGAVHPGNPADETSCKPRHWQPSRTRRRAARSAWSGSCSRSSCWPRVLRCGQLVVRLNNIPPYVLPGPGAVFRTLVSDWPVLSQSLLTTLADHAGRLRRRGVRRHRAGAVVQSVEMAGIFAVSLCGDPAGHAGDRDRAAVADLPAAADRGDRLRLDRRILSGAVQHHARAEFGGSQSCRPVPALRRVAAADAAVI